MIAGVILPTDPAARSCCRPDRPQPDLADIMCVLDDFADGPTPDGCGDNDPPESTDLAPCGRDTVIDVDDILAANTPGTTGIYDPRTPHPSYNKAGVHMPGFRKAMGFHPPLKGEKLPIPDGLSKRT